MNKLWYVLSGQRRADRLIERATRFYKLRMVACPLQELVEYALRGPLDLILRDRGFIGRVGWDPYIMPQYIVFWQKKHTNSEDG